MGFAMRCLKPLQMLNDALGFAGRWIAVAALAAMVAVILLQVFFRYVLNNALPWPDEAARFFMLWMTGMVAPVAYRRGGFVAIDMAAQWLPRRAGAALGLVLLSLAMLVIVMGVLLGHTHTMSGCLFMSSSLWLPVTVEVALPLPGTEASLTLCTKADAALSLRWEWARLPLATMYASIFLGFVLLFLVNLELILRMVVQLLGGAAGLRRLPREVLEAE